MHVYVVDEAAHQLVAAHIVIICRVWIQHQHMMPGGE